MPADNEIICVIFEETEKEKSRKKQKGKKSNKIPENKSVAEERKSVQQNKLCDTENEIENDNEVCSVSTVSSAGSSKNIGLLFDGIMKIAPKYSVLNEHGEEKIENQFSEPPKVIEEDSSNLRALQKYAKTYELEAFDKNYLIIFNQKYITNYEARIGTEKDVKSLKSTFSKCNFECHEYHDLTKDEILEKLKIFETKDFTDYGCVAVAVLTHGTKNGLLRARDREYSEMEIINYFKTHDKPTLVTKPKLLIIQACRGRQQNPVAQVMKKSSLQMRLDRDVEVEPYTLPVESDMLILHSSYNGFPSIRSEVEGSWFIQTLCKKIDELAEELDLESILTEVKREVAVDLHYDQYNRVTFEVDTYKQMPVVTSTLIRKLNLKPDKDQIDGPLNTHLKDSGSERSSQSDISSLTLHSGQCLCYLEHFAYIKNCLSYFLDENPEDEVAQSYLNISNTFEDTKDFNSSKKAVTKAICNHLKNNATSNEYYKYIYMHKH